MRRVAVRRANQASCSTDDIKPLRGGKAEAPCGLRACRRRGRYLLAAWTGVLAAEYLLRAHVVLERDASSGISKKLAIFKDGKYGHMVAFFGITLWGRC